MSNLEDEFYEDDDQPQESNPVRARMKQLEKETRDLRKQVAEAQAAQKELAFVKAGIDLASPMAKYFVKGYDGELSPDAIRLAAEEAQLITPQKPVDDTDKQKWQETNKIATGSETAPPPPSWVERIRNANNESELLAIFDEARAQGIEL
jgi:hypothetical protein